MSKISHTFLKCVIFVTWKSLRLLLSRKELWGILGENCLKVVKQGPSREKKERTGPVIRPHMWGATSQFLNLFPSVLSASPSQTNGFSDQFNGLLRAGFQVHFYDILSPFFSQAI
jgi:hypothetical protein